MRAFWSTGNDKARTEHADRIITHKDLIYSYISKYDFVQQHERDDYFQEVFIYAWRNLNYWEKSQERGYEFGQWLSVTVRSAIFKYRGRLMRKDCALSKSRYILLDDFSKLEIPDFDYEEEHVKALYQAIQNLPDGDRAVVQWYLEGGELKKASLTSGHNKQYFSRKLRSILNRIRASRDDYFEDKELRITYKPDNAPQVVQMNMDGVVIRIWLSARQAEIEGGFVADNIIRVANGQYFSHLGFRWAFVGQEQDVLRREKKNSGRARRPVEQLTESGEVLQLFSSIADATRAGYNEDGLTAVLKGRRTTYKGFVWRYSAP